MLNKFVGIGPKVYGGITIEGKEFVKTKGLKTHISLNQLEELLLENNSAMFEHEKWFNSLEQGSITKRNQIYTLRPTDKKRNLIYKDGKLIGTSNKIINE